ncbi:MAG: ATP-binding protein [Cyanobacteria bacterium J06639_14]
MPASTEFTTLCQSQIAMMAQVVGAESTAVYLAESWTERALPKLIPIAVYPPITDTAESSEPGSLVADKALPGTAVGKVGKQVSQSPQSPVLALDEAEVGLATQRLLLPYSSQSEQAMPQQLAIPLTHEGRVVGILVSRRTDRPWQANERDRLEECAQSLALACVLDQRGQWLQTQLSALNRLQTQQSDRFHELLHQLRNPLTALKTFGKLMAKRLAPGDRNQSIVLSMLRESDRMQDLLRYFDDTLEAADQTRTETLGSVPLLAASEDRDTTLEAEALPVKADSLTHFGGTLKIEPCSIRTLVAPLIDSLDALSEAADVRLHVLPPEHEVTVKADTHALTEIISILLENALKYSPSGSDIWLQWGLLHPHQPDREGIWVGDTGPGIPKADQPRIFDRHYRGIQAVGPTEGSGLGLAIAYDLAQEMAGSIEVHSPLADLPWSLPDRLPKLPHDRGTVFVIWLPRS